MKSTNTARLQAYHIERHYWFAAIASYNAIYWAYYSDWSIRNL